MILQCKVCGASFKTVPSKIKKGHGKFCSHSCRTTYYNKNIKTYNIVKTRKCIICGDMFKYFTYEEKTKKCCSLKCSHLSRRKAFWKNCLICNSVFRAIPSREGRFCSYSCAAKYRTREKNSNWKGGASNEPYNIDFNEFLKEKIRQRDGYICQICGIREGDYKRKLAIHHIDYNKKNSNINNLVSLCGKCHPKTNGKRMFWIDYFNKKNPRADITIEILGGN